MNYSEWKNKYYGIVTFKFLNNNRIEGQKGYDYLLTEEQYKALVKECGDVYHLNTFFIVNDKGYNYRNSEVVVSKMRLVKNINEMAGLCTLENIRKTGEKYIKRTILETPIEVSPIVQIKPIPVSEINALKDNFATVGCVADSCTNSITDLVKEVENLKNKIEEKGNNKMFENVMKDVQFGKVKNVRMSIYGPAFSSGNEWIAYDEKTQNYIDVTGMLIDMDNLCYCAPVPKDKIAIGDFIFHNGGWVRIDDFDDAERPVVEKIGTREITTILPTKNVFGFNFYTKLISYVGNMFNASTDNPFGNLLPLLMLKEGNNDMLPMLMMMNGTGMSEMNFDMSNPMFMYMMLDKGDTSTRDMMMMMAMMNMGKKE